MAQCFCGCGRKVRGFRRRGLNVAGRDALLTIGLLDHAEEVARERGRGDLAGRTAAFASIRDEGQRHVSVLKEVTHGERPPISLDEFKTWLKNAKGMTSFALLDPQLQALISAGASERELGDAQANLDA